jgi:hypothetical protein
LACEDWRSRDQSWSYCRIALQFFRTHEIPFWEMANANALAGNPGDDNSRYCFAKAGELYLIYLPNGGDAALDLTGAEGGFAVQWFNPRAGGPLQVSTVRAVEGGAEVALGPPPEDPCEDWLIVVRRGSVR